MKTCLVFISILTSSILISLNSFSQEFSNSNSFSWLTEKIEALTTDSIIEISDADFEAIRNASFSALQFPQSFKERLKEAFKSVEKIALHEKCINKECEGLFLVAHSMGSISINEAAEGILKSFLVSDISMSQMINNQMNITESHSLKLNQLLITLTYRPSFYSRPKTSAQIFVLLIKNILGKNSQISFELLNSYMVREAAEIKGGYATTNSIAFYYSQYQKLYPVDQNLSSLKKRELLKKSFCSESFLQSTSNIYNLRDSKESGLLKSVKSITDFLESRKNLYCQYSDPFGCELFKLLYLYVNLYGDIRTFDSLKELGKKLSKEFIKISRISHYFGNLPIKELFSESMSSKLSKKLLTGSIESSIAMSNPFTAAPLFLSIKIEENQISENQKILVKEAYIKYLNVSKLKIPKKLPPIESIHNSMFENKKTALKSCYEFKEVEN